MKEVILKILKEEVQLNEGRGTHLLEIMGKIGRMEGMKMIELITDSRGMVGLYRYKDGNAYEITIRPAEYADHPDYFGKLLKKKGGQSVGGIKTHDDDMARTLKKINKDAQN